MPSTSSSTPADLRSRRALLVVGALLIVALVAGITTWIVMDAEDDAGSTKASTSTTCKTQLPVDAAEPMVGSPPPSFVLRSLDGACVDLASFHGRPVVVNFWASWCNPCRDEFPMFKTALAKHRDDGLELLGVVYNDIPSDAREFARDQDADWPLLRDQHDAVAKAYGIPAHGIPQTFFITRDGTLSAHLFGLSERDFNKELHRILADDGS